MGRRSACDLCSRFHGLKRNLNQTFATTLSIGLARLYVFFNADAAPFLSTDRVQGFELFVRYFIGTELGIANLLQRNFDWAANSLWYEDIPHARDPDKTVFLLGAKDDIIHTEVSDDFYESPLL
jgi:hypothetical protein